MAWCYTVSANYSIVLREGATKKVWKPLVENIISVRHRHIFIIVSCIWKLVKVLHGFCLSNYTINPIIIVLLLWLVITEL